MKTLTVKSPYTYVQNMKHLYNLPTGTLLVSIDLYQLNFLPDTFSKVLKHIRDRVIRFGNKNLINGSNAVLRSASTSDAKRGK